MLSTMNRFCPDEIELYDKTFTSLDAAFDFAQSEREKDPYSSAHVRIAQLWPYPNSLPELDDEVSEPIKETD